MYKAHAANSRQAAIFTYKKIPKQGKLVKKLELCNHATKGLQIPKNIVMSNLK